MGETNVFKRHFVGLLAAIGLTGSLENRVLSQPSFPANLEFCAIPAVLPQDNKREPVPSENSLKEAEKEPRNLFKEDYKTRKPEFAEVLLKAVSDQKGDVRYVMLNDAAQIAAENLKFSTSFAALEKMVEIYEAKLDPIVSEALKNAKKKVKTPEQAVELAEFGLQVADLGMKWNEYDAAVRAATEAKSNATKTTDKSLVDRTNEKLKEVTVIKKEYDEFKNAERRLNEIKAEDIAKDASKKTEHEKVSLIVGKWYCFKENKWNNGIYLLKGGSDKELSDIAQKEINILQNNLTSAEKFFEVAEAWYAKSRKGDQRYLTRAWHWYDQSLASATGLYEIKVKKRMGEIDKLTTSNKQTIDLLKMIDPKKGAVVGTWKWEDGKLVSDSIIRARIEIPYQPPQEYDFTMSFVRKTENDEVDLILSKDGKPFRLYIGALGNTISGFGAIKGEDINITTNQSKNWIENGRKYTVLVQVREGSLNAFLDGKLIAQYKTNYSDVSINDLWKLRDNRLLGLGSFNGIVFYESLELKEITGKGNTRR